MKTSKLDLSELLDNEEVIAGVISDALQSNDYSGVKKPSFRNGGNRQTGTLETALAA